MANYFANISGAANIQVPFNPYQVYSGNGNYVRIELNADNLRTDSTKNNAAVWLNGTSNWFSFEMYGEGWEYFNLGSTTYIGRYDYWSTDGFEETLVLEVNNGAVTLTKGQQTSATTFSGSFTSSNISFFPTTYGVNTRVDFYEWKAYGANNTLLFDFVPDYNGTTKGLRDKVSGNFYAATDQTKIELTPLSTFEIAPTSSAATFESGTTTITVNTDNDTSITWTASTNDSWLSLSTLTGAGDGSVVVTYIDNQTFQSRTGSVTFTSSEGDVLTFTIEQEKKPVLVYDHPIYRSGNLVKKMCRSGELIYLRLNPETPPCLTLSPASGSVSSSGSVSFTANYKANCSTGQIQNVTSSATWSVSPSGFGSVSNGVFTANNQEEASTSVTVTAVYSGISATSTVEIAAYEPSTDPLTVPVTFTITSAGNIKWYAQNNSYTKTIQYSKNGGEWTNITSSNAGTMIPVVAGDVVQLRGNNTQYAPQDGRCSCFSGTTAGFTLSGNIMSLIDNTNFATLSSFTAQNVFMNFFNNCTGLTDASDLLLPATALTNYCYQGMLAQCTSLTKGPLLPVEILVTGCYAYLYYHTYNLKEIRCLATTNTNGINLNNWVTSVQTSSGTFYKNPNMSSWGRGSNGVPSNWTIVNYSQTE